MTDRHPTHGTRPGLPVERRGRGCHRTRPDHLLGDKAYSNETIRATFCRRGGRPPPFDAERYPQRNTAERCVNKLKAYRAVATRYDKRDYMYLGTIDVASVKIWFENPVT